MKIIQTLWLPSEIDSPIKNTCGWLSPEYHWISWALSCLQLRKFYNSVELYTNKRGKTVLIDQLQLPYSTVHEVLDNYEVPPSAWAVAKLITYSLQDEPFLHIDGDVFIWKPFENDLLKSALIVQNEEFNLPFYQEAYETFHKKGFTFPPELIGLSFPLHTCNAGVIGGENIHFFKEYTQKALDFALQNVQLIETSIASYFCMFFEQLYLSILSDKYNIPKTSVLNELIEDSSYPGLNNFWEVKQHRWYLHLMNLAKSNRFILSQLATKLRQDYPTHFYKILTQCQSAGITLDFQVFQLPDLSPDQHSIQYFIEIDTQFKPALSPIRDTDWIYQYAKEAFIHRQIEDFYGLSDNAQTEQILFFNEDTEIIEEEEPDIKTYIVLWSTFNLQSTKIELDTLATAILSILTEESLSIYQLVELLKPYFEDDDLEENESLLISECKTRIRDFMFWGVLSYKSPTQD